jgi:SH3-like domain-containing protein
MFRRAVESRTVTEWCRYELVAAWLTLAAMAGAIWFPRLRTGMALVAVIAGVATAATTVALVARARAAPWAIVIAGKTEARFAPAADATAHFSLTEGATVSVREDRGAWVVVERADGQQGWVPSSSLAKINAP